MAALKKRSRSNGGSPPEIYAMKRGKNDDEVESLPARPDIIAASPRSSQEADVESLPYREMPSLQYVPVHTGPRKDNENIFIALFQRQQDEDREKKQSAAAAKTAASAKPHVAWIHLDPPSEKEFRRICPNAVYSVAKTYERGEHILESLPMINAPQTNALQALKTRFIIPDDFDHNRIYGPDTNLRGAMAYKVDRDRRILFSGVLGLLNPKTIRGKIRSLPYLSWGREGPFFLFTPPPRRFAEPLWIQNIRGYVPQEDVSPVWISYRTPGFIQRLARCPDFTIASRAAMAGTCKNFRALFTFPARVYRTLSSVFTDFRVPPSSRRQFEWLLRVCSRWWQKKFFDIPDPEPEVFLQCILDLAKLQERVCYPIAKEDLGHSSLQDYPIVYTPEKSEGMKEAPRPLEKKLSSNTSRAVIPYLASIANHLIATQVSLTGPGAPGALDDCQFEKTKLIFRRLKNLCVCLGDQAEKRRRTTAAKKKAAPGRLREVSWRSPASSAGRLLIEVFPADTRKKTRARIFISEICPGEREPTRPCALVTYEEARREKVDKRLEKTATCEYTDPVFYCRDEVKTQPSKLLSSFLAVLMSAEDLTREDCVPWQSLCAASKDPAKAVLDQCKKKK